MMTAVGLGSPFSMGVCPIGFSWSIAIESTGSWAKRRRTIHARMILQHLRTIAIGLVTQSFANACVQNLLTYHLIMSISPLLSRETLNILSEKISTQENTDPTITPTNKYCCGPISQFAIIPLNNRENGRY